MLEEAKLDDLLTVTASIASQEIHIVRQMHNANDDELENLARWLHTFRSMRRELEQEFVGVNGKEELERTHIGEEGCDLKHCLIGYCHMYEIIEKDARQFFENESANVNPPKHGIIQRVRSVNAALSLMKKHISDMELFRVRIFELRNKLREDMGVEPTKVEVANER